MVAAILIVCVWSHSAITHIPQTDLLLERTRIATLASAEAMPDFLVKQIIKRSKAYGTSSKWLAQDNLTVAVGYRAIGGEQYKVIKVNDQPLGREAQTGKDYSRDVAPGVSSSGVEYVSALANVFKPESKTIFKFSGTDLINGRPTVVYEYEVKQPLSQLTLRTSESSLANVGSRGRVWVDREINRVIRFEQIATEIPADFPITSATSLIDYDWVTIADRKYLLPVRSEILLTRKLQKESIRSRNEISFEGYRKFGAELKVIDEIDEKDFRPAKP